MLWGKCKDLYKRKLINRFWVYNGIINVVSIDENRHKIAHVDDLDNILERKNKENLD